MTVPAFDPSVPEDSLPEVVPAEPIIPEPVSVECWRCGHTIPGGLTVCPYCRAWVGPGPEPQSHRRSSPSWPPLLKAIAGFSLILSVSLFWAVARLADDHRSEHDTEVVTLALEIADTVIVLAVWAWIGRLNVPKPRLGARLAAWLIVPAALAGVMAVNRGYRALLEEYLRNEWLQRLLERPPWTPMTIALMAVQPAIVEELFFRHLAYGALRTVSGVHAAVWVSAVMFAVAHVYNPLGLPWLLVAGVAFGYCRAATGGLLAPMLMHFVHNLVMVWLEGQ